jgi:hypothetical protein
MDATEIFVFISSCVLLFLFVKRWYLPLFRAWPRKQNLPAKIVLGLLPVIFLALIVYTLKFWASFDVVDSVIYIIFYIVLGYAWIYGGLLLVSACFDLHWTYDAVHLNNRAAIPVITGEFFALAAIYAGANVGDGPGWWCVLFAGGLGLAAWLLLGWVFHRCTGIFERITVERDTGCGIRFCLYLLVSGAILGYACSGDWTSFVKTVEEFAVGWPVLPWTAIMILLELFFKQKAKREVSR